jgi:tetratricopeptide (TPR) repeat protein
MSEGNPLLARLQRCVVRIDADAEFLGTGFFVSPGELITCAHVVHGIDAVSLTGEEWSGKAEVRQRAPDLPPDAGEARFYPLPDLALLQVVEPCEPHPCVRLSSDLPRAGLAADVLHLAAWTRNEHSPGKVNTSSAAVEYVGPVKDAELPLLKLAKGLVLRGYSGCPALNLQTGSVCAVIDSTRSETSELGGFGVPVSALEIEFPGLAERNRAFHARDNGWEQDVEAERVAKERRGGLARPLLPPLLDLNWDSDDPPSKLLRPRYGVVGMIGRERLQEGLMRWRESNKRLAVALLTGDGGYGKTRLALEECAAAERARWTAGLLHLPAGPPGSAELDAIVAWPGRMLIAIDYAETRPDVVGKLLHLLINRDDGPPVRIIIICRQGLTKQQLVETFSHYGDPDQIEEVLRESEPIQLGEDSLDRQELFESGAAALARRLERTLPTLPPMRLEQDHFDRPLFVLAAALLWLEDPHVDLDAMGSDELMLEMLDQHESRYWSRWNEYLEAELDRDLQHRVMAVAAALGGESEGEVLSLVRSVPGVDSFSGEGQRKVAQWLSRIYGDGGGGTITAISPIEPDSLAEALIVREYRSRPDLFARTLEAASPRQRERFIAVATRATGGDSRGAPATFAKGVFGQAIEHYRRLAEDDPDRYMDELAASLRNLSEVLAAVGRATEAVDAIEGAVDCYRDMTERDPERYGDHLAQALNEYGHHLNAVGRSKDALAAIEEAVRHYRGDSNGS